MLDKYFDYQKHKTDFKTEVIAGVSTFLTMAYIMFLNPVILADGGFDFGGVFTATALAAALACFIAAFLCKNMASRFSTWYGNKCFYSLWSLFGNGIYTRRSSWCCIGCRCSVLNNFTYTSKSLAN